MKTIITGLVLLITFQLFGQTNKIPLEVGELAPEINAFDQNGLSINSGEILVKQKILLIFYRGNWCPHCKKHLSSLEEHLNEFREKGIFVMVVTPESLEKTKETEKKFKTNFSIIHDTDNKIMEDYKVAFEVNKDNVPNYYGYVSKKVAQYNVDNNMVLPVPATYIIDQDGKISYVHFDPDYKNRSNFEEILNML